MAPGESAPKTAPGEDRRAARIVDGLVRSAKRRRGRVGRLFLSWRARPIGGLRCAAGAPPPAWPQGQNAGQAAPYWPAVAGNVFAFGRLWPLPVDPDGEPDWRREPIHWVSWPARKPTETINMRGPSRAGDVKCVWEPSRFNLAFDLCRAASGGPEVARQISTWIDQNRWLLGVHWDNGLEAALRAIAWTFADGVLTARGDPAWRAIRDRVLSALVHHGAFIAARLDRGALNHLVADAAGLAIIGASHPTLPGAAHWQKLGQDLLLSEIERQVLADGGHVERAPAYARFVADLYLLAGVVLRAAGAAGSDELVRAASRLLEPLMLQMTPEGDLPGYGDDDGAMVLWNSRPEHRLAISLGLGAALLGRGDFKFAALSAGATTRVGEVVAAVLGAGALARFDALPADPPGPRLVHLPDTGVLVHRDNWTRSADWLLFRCGPAAGGRGAHAHADQLEVLWSTASGFRLVDPGTPTYGGDDAIRWSSTSTLAHNTVSVDGASQAERLERFAWRELPAGQLVENREEGRVLRATGRLRFAASGVEATHERTIEKTETALEIADRVRCGGSHRVAASMLFRGTLKWDALAQRLVRENGAALGLSWRGWADLSLELSSWSPVYEQSQPATRVVLSSAMRDQFDGVIRLERRDA